MHPPTPVMRRPRRSRRHRDVRQPCLRMASHVRPRRCNANMATSIGRIATRPRRAPPRDGALRRLPRRSAQPTTPCVRARRRRSSVVPRVRERALPASSLKPRARAATRSEPAGRPSGYVTIPPRVALGRARISASHARTTGAFAIIRRAAPPFTTSSRNAETATGDTSSRPAIERRPSPGYRSPSSRSRFSRKPWAVVASYFAGCSSDTQKGSGASGQVG